MVGNETGIICLSNHGMNGGNMFEKPAMGENGHWWSGWPGAHCLYCGQEDPNELEMCAMIPYHELVSDGLLRDCPGNTKL